MDSSVILRRVLEQDAPLAEWDEIEVPIASTLAQVECFRVFDRLRLTGTLSDGALADRYAYLRRIIGSVQWIDMNRDVVARASLSFPVSLRTLDAIHLSTALLWAEAEETSPVFATHDERLSLAARAFGLDVVGV